VVADEVRRLAQRSAAAARETAALIDTSKATTARGVTAAQNVDHDFKIIIQDIVQVRGLLQQATESSRLQADEVQSMSAAVRQLEHGTSESAAKADSFAQFASALRTRADELALDAADLTRFLGSAKNESTESEAAATPGAQLNGHLVGSAARSATHSRAVLPPPGRMVGTRC
jgi:methyl-accepting chemotaxis protein